MVQPSSIDAVSILVHSNDYNSVLAFVLRIYCNVNTMDYFNFYSLKKNMSQNKMAAFHRLILSFLTTTLTKTHNDQVRTSKRVTF